jgi:hypothetical protein
MISSLGFWKNLVLPSKIGKIRRCQHRLIRAVAFWPLIRTQQPAALPSRQASSPKNCRKISVAACPGVEGRRHD